MKSLISILLLLSFTVEAKNYILVGISGFGTRKDTEEFWQPSGAHDNLPRHKRISKTYKLVHYSKSKELDEVMSKIVCQGQKANGLIIMANSWGAGNAHKLMKKFEKKCNRGIDFLVMVDGVSKPLAPYGSFLKKPRAQKCVNFYQTMGAIRGTDIDSCKNHNFTRECVDREYGGVDCHIYTEWAGTNRGAQLILNYIDSNP